MSNKDFNERLDAILDEYEKQLRIDISNHISGDKSRNAAFSHIDARKSLIALVDEVTELKVQEAKWDGAIESVEAYLEELKKTRVKRQKAKDIIHGK